MTRLRTAWFHSSGKHLIMTALTLALTLVLDSDYTQAQQSEIPGVVSAGAALGLVREGFIFTEGPVSAKDGTLYFSDLRSSLIYDLNKDGSITIAFRETNGANGLAFAPNGELLAAGGDGKTISQILDGHLKVICSRGIEGSSLMAPNDLIVDRNGGVYFTDPGPRPLVPERKAYVYYLPPHVNVPILINDDITRPNGITLTNDGKTLLVDDTVGDTVFAFTVHPDGTASEKRVFARLRNLVPGKESGADGMAIDDRDRLYVTSISGVQVFDRNGTYLGTISVPRQPTNVAFSGPNKSWLYVTAREGLYRIKTRTQGPHRLGK
jgi:gluconolactonase